MTNCTLKRIFQSFFLMYALKSPNYVNGFYSSFSRRLPFHRTPYSKIFASSTSKKKKDQVITHWKDPQDKVVITEDGNIRFIVRGNPQPLRRHRTARGFLYNPSAKAQESFSKVVRLLFEEHVPSLNLGDDSFFGDSPLAMDITFRLRRPRNHFVNNNPGKEGGLTRLKKTSPRLLCNSRVDVDNLGKFVMDACNGLLYVDDKQVSRLTLCKVYDCYGQCNGSTEVFVRKIDDQSIENLLL